MKKIRMLMYGLASAAAVVAPVATVISCGESGSSTPAQTNPNGNLPAEKSSAYTYQTFTDEAKKYNDNARWTAGVGYHAVLSTVSFLRAMAEKYGYSTPDSADNKSQREKDLRVTKDEKGDTISSDVFVQADGTVLGTPSDEQQKVINTLKTFKQTDSTINQTLKMASVGDESAYLDFDSLNRLNISSEYTLSGISAANSTDKGLQIIKVDTKKRNDLAEQLSFNWYSFYDDPSTPGQTILLMHDEKTSVLFEIKLKGVQSIFPKISESEFKASIEPTITDSLKKLLQLYNKTGVADLIKSFAGTLKDYLVFSELDFLVKKITKNGQWNADANFEKYLLELNASGNIHWLGVKALYLGFDGSLTTGKIAPFTVEDGHWPYKGGVTGIKDTGTFSTVIDWAHYNNFKAQDNAPASIPKNTQFSNMPLEKQDEKSLDFDRHRLTYVATKSVEDNLKDAGYTDKNVEWLQTYIDFLG